MGRGRWLGGAVVILALLVLGAGLLYRAWSGNCRQSDAPGAAGASSTSRGSSAPPVEEPAEPSAAASQESAGSNGVTLWGRVRDPAGRARPGGHVWVIWRPADESELMAFWRTAAVGEDGTWEIAGLFSGRIYRLTFVEGPLEPPGDFADLSWQRDVPAGSPGRYEVDLVSADPVFAFQARVEDESGIPASGVTVCFWPADQSGLPGAEGRSSREGLIEGAVGFRWMHLGLGAESEEYILVGRDREDVIELRPDDVTMFRVVVRRLLLVAGRIVDAVTGEPPAIPSHLASVYLQNPSADLRDRMQLPGAGSRSPDPDYRFRCYATEPGTCTLIVEVPPFRMMGGIIYEKARVEGIVPPRDDLEIRLEPGPHYGMEPAAMDIEVEAPAGATAAGSAIAGVSIYYFTDWDNREERDQPWWTEGMLRAVGSRQEVTVHRVRAAAVEFVSLVPARYLATATTTGPGPVYTGLAEVDASRSGSRARGRILLEPAQTVQGQVVNPDGMPFPSVSLGCHLAQYGEAFVRTLRRSQGGSTTDGQGRFRFGNLLPTEYLLRIDVPDREPVVVRFDPRAATDLGAIVVP